MPKLRWHCRVTTGCAVLATLTLVGAFAVPQPARAGIVMVTGNGDILTPGVDKTGALPNFFQDKGDNPKVHGWNEQQNVTLDRDVFVDLTSTKTVKSAKDLGGLNQLKIAKGTVVSSHLLYFDPKDSRNVKGVTFTFDADILGVIVESDRFHNKANNFTDYFIASDFLGNPLTAYPVDKNGNPNHFNNRGLELDDQDAISVNVTGRTLTVDIFQASSPGDQLRVITAGSPGVAAIPAPAGILLALVAAGGFGAVGLRRLRRRRGA